MTIMAISRDAASGGTEYATTAPVLLDAPPRVECTFASFDAGKGELEAAIRGGAIADLTDVEDAGDLAVALGGSLVRLALPEWRPEAATTETREEKAATMAAALLEKRAERAAKAAP